MYYNYDITSLYMTHYRTLFFLYWCFCHYLKLQPSKKKNVWTKAEINEFSKYELFCQKGEVICSSKSSEVFKRSQSKVSYSPGTTQAVPPFNLIDCQVSHVLPGSLPCLRWAQHQLIQIHEKDWLALNSIPLPFLSRGRLVTISNKF